MFTPISMTRNAPGWSETLLPAAAKARAARPLKMPMPMNITSSISRKCRMNTRLPALRRRATSGDNAGD